MATSPLPLDTFLHNLAWLTLTEINKKMCLYQIDTVIVSYKGFHRH